MSWYECVKFHRHAPVSVWLSSKETTAEEKTREQHVLLRQIARSVKIRPASLYPGCSADVQPSRPSRCVEASCHQKLRASQLVSAAFRVSGRLRTAAHSAERISISCSNVSAAAHDRAQPKNDVGREVRSRPISPSSFLRFGSRLPAVSIPLCRRPSV